MIEVKKDFWGIPCDWKAIPTNGMINKVGKAIMGAGLALQAREKLPGIDQKLGSLLGEYGNRVFYLGTWDGYTRYYSFPTKYNWQNKSSIFLIEKSCQELKTLLSLQISENESRNMKAPYLALPRVGAGKGGLDYNLQIKPILEQYFGEMENVYIVEEP